MERLPEPSSQAVDQLLEKWGEGDHEEALRALLPLIYNELRRVGHRVSAYT